MAGKHDADTRSADDRIDEAERDRDSAEDAAESTGSDHDSGEEVTRSTEPDHDPGEEVTRSPERDRDAGEEITGSAEPDQKPPPEVSDGIESMAEQIETLRAELETGEERYLRLAAEFDNYRKRVGRERDEAQSRARAEMVSPLLDVLDDLQRVSEQEPDNTSAAGVIEGARLVEKKFRHALASLGLETIQAENEFFNPAIMEALMTVPTDDEADDDSVAEVIQKGYRFGNVLIRPARVSVKKYEADADETASE